MSWWFAIAQANDVTVTVDRYRDLVAPPPIEPAPAPFVERRDVVVSREGDELVIRAQFRVSVPEPGPVALTVAGPGVRVDRFSVDGVVRALGGGSAGPLFAAALARPSTLSLVGRVSVPEGGGPVTVSLLGAGAGELELPPDLALVDGIHLGAGRWIPAAPDRTMDHLAIEQRAPDTSDRGQLVLGRVGYGVTALDGELHRAARLQWRIVSGSLTEVAFTVPSGGPDLVVEGPQVGEVSRSGDRVLVQLAGEERALVELVVRATSVLGTSEVTTLELGLPSLEGVFRTEATVAFARDGELDLVPRLTGMTARSVLGLPALVDGLLDGSPAAAFVGSGGSGQLDILRFTPAEGPATLCDVATYTVALTDEGRALVRAHWTVRNDRGHLLHIQPPPGYEPVAALVSGRPVTVSRDGDLWLVPLDKSVETVRGLLSFPVEVAFLGTGSARPVRRLRQGLQLPSIDAETAVVHATVHLPPGFEDRSRPGEGDRVDGFTEGTGISYGFAVGDVRAAQAEQLFQSALQDWNGNDFSGASQKLDAIRALGGENDNTVALGDNLAVVTGKRGESTTESAIDRRIKDQARSRALEDFEEQRRLLDEAERATNEGRYEEAARSYSSASSLTSKLAGLSNAEDVAQTSQLDDLVAKNKGNAAVANQKSAYRSQAAGPVDLEEQKKAEKADEKPAAESMDLERNFRGPPEPPVDEPSLLPSIVPVGSSSIVLSEFDLESPPATTAPTLAVVATSASVVLPGHGAPVRFQHLLLPADAQLVLPIDARFRPNPRSRSPR